MNDPRSANEFTALDWVGCVWVVVWFLHLYFFSFISASFQESFLSMGASLPLLTLMAFKPWFGPLLGVFCTGIFALQWVDWFHKRLLRRRLIVVLAFIMASLFGIVCVIALYLPIFRMASVLGGN